MVVVVAIGRGKMVVVVVIGRGEMVVVVVIGRGNGDEVLAGGPLMLAGGALPKITQMGRDKWAGGTA